VRLLAHVDTALTPDQIRHVYLHGARNLRTDLGRDDDPAGSIDGARS
jgi:chorismate mutase